MSPAFNHKWDTFHSSENLNKQQLETLQSISGVSYIKTCILWNESLIKITTFSLPSYNHAVEESSIAGSW